MRSRLATIGILLLVMAVLVLGLTGCERQAEQRGTSATEEADSSQGGSAPSGEADVPAPGETLVSAATSEPQTTPGTQPQATVPPPSGGTPIESAPTVTTAPGDTAQPTVAPAASPTPGGGAEVWHTVQRGETVYSIAKRYGTTVDAIAAANNLPNPQTIYVGQKLKIPTSGDGSTAPPPTGSTGCRIQHTVKPGEWVWQIARTYGVSAYDIIAANNLGTNASNITPGQVLCIP